MDLFSDTLNVKGLNTALELLKESREGFLKLFDNSPVCMSMTTTDLGKRVYVRVNKKFLDRFGYSNEEIVGHTSTEVGILDEKESDRVRSIISEKGRLQNDYVRCIAKNGEVVHTVSSIEFMTINGKDHLVSFFVDISKIISQQDLIEKHLHELEAVNHELEAFSYSVSHDLRAPLRAISTYARILEEDFGNRLDEGGKKVIMALQRNSTSMTNLIDDLLKFAKLGKSTLVKEQIDMNNLVAEVLFELQTNMHHHATIRVGTLHGLYGDLPSIRQVMINLISNAIKYSSKKAEPIIEISSKMEGKDVIYTVSDNGTGFDMEFVEKLFGVFQRLHPASEFEGTGVGLATVQRIIAKHGGTVHAEGQVGKGATFSFRIPAE